MIFRCQEQLGEWSNKKTARVSDPSNFQISGGAIFIICFYYGDTLCMKQRHSVTHAVQRGKMETYAPKFLFLASIYILLCVWMYILCIVHKCNLSVWSYNMSGETFWSGVWFSYKKDLKMGCKNQNCIGNIDPLLTLTCLLHWIDLQDDTICVQILCWQLSPSIGLAKHIKGDFK
jgi:hypothetical protein